MQMSFVFGFNIVSRKNPQGADYGPDENQGGEGSDEIWPNQPKPR